MLWESSLKNKNDFPTYQQMLEFLRTRSRALAAAAAAGDSTKESKDSSKPKQTANSYTATTKGQNNNTRCKHCKETHMLAQCRKFRSQRRNFINNNRLCFNCIKPGHATAQCPSPYRCMKCQNKHHTLLHFTSNKGANSPDVPTATVSESAPAPPAQANVTALQNTTRGKILIATARVVLENENEQRITVRALLDSGADATFITERVVQQLRLRKRKVEVPIVGLQNTSTGHAT